MEAGGSYYEAFGETMDIGESVSGESAMSEGQSRGRRWSRPGSAATGGVSSGSASGDVSGFDFYEPRSNAAWDGWAEDGSWRGGTRTGPGSPRGMTDGSLAGLGATLRIGAGRMATSPQTSVKAREAPESGRPPTWTMLKIRLRARLRGCRCGGWREGEREDRWRAVEKKNGKISNSYPPVFKARPQESYLEWKRSVEFWVGGEGGQLPAELVGPRQLKERAGQLVKRLSNGDVNGPEGKEVIFKALEKSPLIKQLDKHRVDKHRLVQLNCAPGESMEFYVTWASIYRTHLLGMDGSMGCRAL